jgi:hypothetical protein
MVDDFDSQSVDALKDDVGRARDDTKLAAQKVRKAEQANDLRDSFFKLAAALAILTVCASVGLVIAVLAGRSISDTVAVAFVSGLAVETVGILAIMAGYLFPRESDR